MPVGLIERLKQVVLGNSGSEPVRLLNSFIPRFQGTSPFSPVVVFGDSVTLRVSRNDSDKRSLVELLGDEFRAQGRATAGFAYTAFHPGVFAAVGSAFAGTRQRPSAIVCPINLRCFAPQWDLHPKYQYHDLLDAAEADGVVVLRNQELTDAQYRALPAAYVGGGIISVGDVVDLIEGQPKEEPGIRRRLSAIFSFHYGHPLAADHRHLRHLALIKALADSLGIPVTFYVAPVNHEAGADFVPTFKQAIAQSVEKIRGVLAGSALHDFSRSFGRQDFFSPTNATEHVQEAARKAIASAIAGSLRRGRS